MERRLSLSVLVGWESYVHAYLVSLFSTSQGVASAGGGGPTGVDHGAVTGLPSAEAQWGFDTDVGVTAAAAATRLVS